MNSRLRFLKEAYIGDMDNPEPHEFIKMNASDSNALNVLKSRYNRLLSHIINERYHTRQDEEACLQALDQLRAQIEHFNS